MSPKVGGSWFSLPLIVAGVTGVTLWNISTFLVLSKSRFLGRCNFWIKILLVADIKGRYNLMDWSAVFLAETIDRIVFVADFVAICAIFVFNILKHERFLVHSKAFIIKCRGPLSVFVACVRPHFVASFVVQILFKRDKIDKDTICSWFHGLKIIFCSRY